jgi:uncharacterized membrane protein
MRTLDERVMLGIAALGIILALYSVYLHYTPEESHVCNLSETFNCDAVNKSQYSVFMGIPVAILGTLAYLAVFLVLLKHKRIMRWLDFTDTDFWQYLTIIALFMFLFQSYLTMTEFLFIKAYCVVCLMSQASTTALLALAARRRFHRP